MKVRLAKTAGFCMGVKRAIDKVLEVAEHDRRKVYTYGPLIHNPQAIDMLEQRGVTAREQFDRPEDAIVVIRAHGITPQQRRELVARGLEIVDATCPHVQSSQRTIERHVARGYSVVIVGDRDHAEVTGLLGFCEGRGTVISSLAEAQSVELREPVCVVAQTTFDERLYGEIAEALRLRATQVEVVSSICRATNERQQEVRQLAADCEAIVVVGGRTSANTRRLAEIATAAGTPVFAVETAAELDLAAMSRYALIGVTAGASTPTWITQEVIERIEEYGRRRLTIRAAIRYLASVVSLSSFSTAAAAFSLAYLSQILQGLPEPHWQYSTIAFAYVFFIYTLNLAQSLSEEERSKPERAAFYRTHRVAVWAMGAPLAAASLVLAGWESWRGVLPILLGAYVLGALYNVPLLGSGGRRRLKDIPASKDMFSALAWTLVTALLPAIGDGWPLTAATYVTGLAALSLVLCRSLLFDLAEVRSDRILGAETLPVLIGERRSRWLTVLLLTATACLLLAGGQTGVLPPLAFWLLAALVPLAAFMILSIRGVVLSHIVVPMVVDGVIFLMGLVALGWKVAR